MEKYSLEIENWGDWTLERDFSSFDRAKRHGIEKFPQNDWRIYDRVTRQIVYQHSPLEEVARQETRRFAETERWRQVYADRAADAVVARQQRERMAEVAARQRERDQARRSRLRGFNFVGPEPAILSRRSVMEELFLRDLEAWDRPKKRSSDIDHVNWLKEGF